MWNGVSSKIGRHESLLKSSRGMFINTGNIFSETALRNWFILTKVIFGYLLDSTDYRIKSQPHKMVNQNHNCLATADELFECVWPFCGVGAYGYWQGKSTVK